MPIYEYKCDNCSHGFDIKQNFHDKPLKKCPECNKHKLHRVISILYSSVKGPPTTLHHQAARNTEQMGKYELQEKLRKDYNDHADAPAWRKGRGVNMKLNKMTKDQKRQYIQKGIYPNDSFKPKESKGKL